MSLFTETPFAFFYGANDTTCSVAQTAITVGEMGNSVQVNKMYEGIGHGDFIAYDTEEFVQDVLDFLKPAQSNDLASPWSSMLQ